MSFLIGLVFGIKKRYIPLKTYCSQINSNIIPIESLINGFFRVVPIKTLIYPRVLFSVDESSLQKKKSSLHYIIIKVFAFPKMNKQAE